MKQAQPEREHNPLELHAHVDPDKCFPFLDYIYIYIYMSGCMRAPRIWICFPFPSCAVPVHEPYVSNVL